MLVGLGAFILAAGRFVFILILRFRTFDRSFRTLPLRLRYRINPVLNQLKVSTQVQLLLGQRRWLQKQCGMYPLCCRCPPRPRSLMRQLPARKQQRMLVQVVDVIRDLTRIGCVSTASN